MNCKMMLPLMVWITFLHACGGSTSFESVPSSEAPSEASGNTPSIVSIVGFEALPPDASQGEQFTISGGIYAGTSITIGATLGSGFKVVKASVPNAAGSSDRYIYVTDDIETSFKTNLALYQAVDTSDSRYPKNYQPPVIVGNYQIVRDHLRRDSTPTGWWRRFEFKMSILSASGTELATAKLYSHDYDNQFASELRAKGIGSTFIAPSGRGPVMYTGKTELQQLRSDVTYEPAYTGDVTMNLDFANNTGTLSSGNLSNGSFSGSYSGTLTISPETGQLTDESGISLTLNNVNYTADVLGILSANGNAAAGTIVDTTNNFHGLFAVGNDDQ